MSAKKRLELTEAQIVTLRYALALADQDPRTREYDGVSARRGQFGMYANLEMRGLLKFGGMGENFNARTGNARPCAIYVITKKGRKALEQATSERA